MACGSPWTPMRSQTLGRLGQLILWFFAIFVCTLGSPPNSTPHLLSSFHLHYLVFTPGGPMSFWTSPMGLLIVFHVYLPKQSLPKHQVPTEQPKQKLDQAIPSLYITDVFTTGLSSTGNRPGCSATIFIPSSPSLSPNRTLTSNRRSAS